jgi:hypothetical protein
VKRVAALGMIFAVVLGVTGCTLFGHATTTTSTTAAATTTLPPTTSPPTTIAPTTTSTDSSTTTTVETMVFQAQLSGKQVVPPVPTIATGSATFTFEPSLNKAYFKLKLSTVSGVTASRVKEGKPGENGQGILILYPGPDIAGPFTGVLAQGYFDASALIGSLQGKTLADLMALFKSGQAYVNVGTIQHADGEIRGQITGQKGATTP